MYNDRYLGISDRIAKWRELSEFEIELANSAEESPVSKRLYSSYYRHLNPEYYKKGKEVAYQLFKSHKSSFEGTAFDEIYTDMVYCLHRYGLSFQDYCIYNLINKSERCRQNFVADKLRYHYCDILNGKGIQQIMTDKFECYNKYSQFFKRKVIPCIHADGLQDFIEFTNHVSKFIYKPLAEHSGHGISIINSNPTDLKRWFLETAAERPGIVEELIVQGKEMNKMNPGSINSCRIVSFTIADNVTIIGGALRMGVGESVTDNAGSGGIYASIDTEHGVIQSDAKNYLNQHFKYHPTTGTPIIGFKLPEWDKAVELVRQMSTHLDGTTLISWDIAYGKDGWCMVEANDNGDWSIIQSNLEIGRKDELYALMDKYFIYKANETETFYSTALDMCQSEKRGG